MQSARFLPFFFLFAAQALFAQQKGYYMSPCLYKNTVVFTAEGDLWKYDLSGGSSSRLTTHQGVETNPALSPDGKELAFTGQYEGVTEIYTMNINGGVPRRLTYEFENYYMHISGWTKDGQILYSTTRYGGLPSPQLMKLDPVTLNREPVPLWEAADGCYDDSGTLYFTRFPDQGSKTKRYKGGFIQQIWKFDGIHEASCLTGDFDGTSARPMIYNNRIYFLSDRDGTMNIWSMDKDGHDLKQISFSKGWDIKSASIYDSKIVYQKGADIWIYDGKTNQEKRLDIFLLSDFDQRKPRWIKSPVNTITYSDISPNGNYAAIISRGRLFVSPSKSDRWVEPVRRSGIRFKEVHFINEKTLAVLSDESGEFEIWSVNADGSGTAKQISKNSKTLIRSFAVSPNGKYIAYNDKNDMLRIAETVSGVIKLTYGDAYGSTDEITWSPDSRFLNFSRGLENQCRQICVVDMQTLKIIPATTGRLNSYSPAWTGDSRWLYFVSQRDLHTRVRSPWGPREPEPFYNETENIYAMPLDTSSRFPFLQTDSWLTDSTFNNAPEKDAPVKAGKKEKGSTASVSPAPYNWEKASRSLYAVPVKSSNLNGVDIAADGFLYWIDNGADDNANTAKLFALRMKESKKYEPVEVASGVVGFNLSANKKKILISFANRTIAIADASGQKLEVDKAKLELENWNFLVNPPEDWKEIFEDAWRMTRDYFYDRDLHKVDWVAVRNQYEPLLDRVTDRYELDDLISEMVGELSALHTFVYGGDKRVSPDQIPSGFLGALLRQTAGGLVIEHIYQSDPDYPEASSPLNKPELTIKEGDIVTAVNNVSLRNVPDIAELLANKVGIPVKLSLLNSRQQPYEQVVKPFSAAEDERLRYNEWELTRREKVDSLGNGDIGYVHLKAMGTGNMDDFVKQFYPVYNRKGLIIDVRHNFGGNIDSWVLEKLMRKAWMYWQGRAGGPYPNMQYAFQGHMVILCDQVTSSDGEAVTEGFRRLGLGKVIGMRTWGGEIWLTSSNRLVDNGIATAAEFGVYGPEGKWLIEGRGVEPDMTVDNLPFESYKGRDAQLEYAIDYLKKEIKANPVTMPQAPPHPDKSFKY
jgi:tricorn protease